MTAPHRWAGGTGKFAGTSGHGTHHVNVLAVLARSGGKCRGQALRTLVIPAQRRADAAAAGVHLIFTGHCRAARP